MLKIGFSASCLFLAVLLLPAIAQEPTITAPPGITRETVMTFNEGAKYLNSKDYARSCEKFAQVIKAAPMFAEAHLNYGTSLQGVGQYNEGLVELKRAIEIKPSLPNAWYSLGTCYQNMGKNKEAIDAYKQYLRIDPHGQFATITQSSVTVLETELKRTAGLSSVEDSTSYIAEVTQNGAIRWPENRMPISIYIKPGNDVPGYKYEFEGILRQAFEEWVDAAQGKIKITYTSDPDEAAIKCNWTNNPKELSTIAEGGQAVVVPDSQGIRSTNITLLTVYPMSDNVVTGNYLRRVCLHEVGHAFGLYGHSRTPEDVMFCTIHPGEQFSELSARDKNTLLTLYKTPADKFAKRTIDMSKVALSGDPTSPLNRSIAMNAEGVEALKAHNFPLALNKFQTAIQTCPSNEFVRTNVAVCYSAWGASEANAGRYDKSEEYLRKAVDILEQEHDKEKLQFVQKNLSILLRKLQRVPEAEAIEAKLKNAN